ncbi:MAG: Ppx-GppA protein [Campylobacterota bacterium]|nr:Ppx-GppA protein [Campylobacterota bacterium]
MIAIDLGSNTIRFIEYDGVSWGKSYEKIVRTAQSLHATNRICEDALVRVLDAIDEAKKHLDFSNNDVVAVTTAALRMASNGVEIIARIYEHCGVKFKIIEGEREAQLTLLAVKNRLNELQINSDNFVLADIGGGSTELIAFNHEKTHTVSLPIGIVTMSEKAVDASMLRQLLDDFERKTALFCRSLGSTVDIPRLVLTSGTPTTIAAYRMGMNYSNYDPMKINGSTLTRADCVATYQELMEMDESTRAVYVGVGREELIATGILMIESLFEGLNLEEALIIDDGLREGVALSYTKLN